MIILILIFGPLGPLPLVPLRFSLQSADASMVAVGSHKGRLFVYSYTSVSLAAHAPAHSPAPSSAHFPNSTYLPSSSMPPNTSKKPDLPPLQSTVPTNMGGGGSYSNVQPPSALTPPVANLNQNLKVPRSGSKFPPNYGEVRVSR